MSRVNLDDIVCVGTKIDEVRKNLNFSEDEIVRLDSRMAYFYLDDVYFGILSGKCEFYFIDEKLFRAEYTPSLKEYIHELNNVTREGLYDCVSKAFEYMTQKMDSKGLQIIEKSKRKSIYKEKESRIIIAIDREYESVCMTKENEKYI